MVVASFQKDKLNWTITLFIAIWSLTLVNGGEKNLFSSTQIRWLRGEERMGLECRRNHQWSIISAGVEFCCLIPSVAPFLMLKIWEWMCSRTRIINMISINKCDDSMGVIMGIHLAVPHRASALHAHSEQGHIYLYFKKAYNLSFAHQCKLV